MRNRNHQGKLILFALVAFVLACAAASAQEKIEFPVGVGTKTIGTNMFWLATKKGFFDNIGWGVQPVLLRGTVITMQALVSESCFLRSARPRPGPTSLP
jgi:ABC-type nitrate/sulfonate/bicarbonate transport system substrate-binding protein